MKGTELHNFFKVASSSHSKPEGDDHQNFQKAPPVVKDVHTVRNAGGGAVVDIHVDWSRKSRNTLKVLEPGEALVKQKLQTTMKQLIRLMW